MPARHLVIGLDGADVDVIGQLGPTALPAIHALMERGAWARLVSVQPPATLPNWTTFLTGADPGAHGVFDFTTRDGYRVAFSGGTVREVPTVAASLDAMGLRCACLGFPGTWPPERLERGVFMSGWDSPVAFEADRSFVHPPELYDEIRERFGPIRFDDVDELGAERSGWHERLPGLLEERVERETKLARWLLGRQDWDLFAFYFGESDTAAHHLWAFHDPGSPRYRPGAPDALATVYRALDRAVARLVAEAGDEVEVTLVSDHGSGGSGETVLYLNRVLEAAGLLAFEPEGRRVVPFLKDLALTRLGPRTRQAMFSLAGRALPGFVESRARFGAIRWAETRAFSDELNYFPAIHFNVRGREPEGTVEPAELPQLRARVTQVLRSLRDPWTGEPVVAEVWDREALYRGPYVRRAPDLLLELHLDRGYSYNVMPTSGAPPGTGPWRRLGREEHLGRKGRSLAGSHRPRGLYVAAGPSVRPVGEIRARMADATATLLARMGLTPASQMNGRVLREAIRRRASRPLAEAAPSPGRRGDPARLEARLRALGYLE